MKTLEKKTRTATAVTTTTKARTASKSVLETPAIFKGVLAATVAIFDSKGEAQDLGDYLTPRQIGRIEREAKSEGFESAIDFLEKFMSDSIREFLDKSPAIIGQTIAIPAVALTIPPKVSAMFKDRSVTPERFVNDMMKAVFATTDLREVIDDLYPETGTPARIEGLFVVGGRD